MIAIAFPLMADAAEPTTTTRTTTREEFPDPFRFNDGRRVESEQDWQARRKELLDTILAHQYGHSRRRRRMSPPRCSFRTVTGR